MFLRAYDRARVSRMMLTFYSSNQIKSKNNINDMLSGLTLPDVHFITTSQNISNKQYSIPKSISLIDY